MSIGPTVIAQVAESLRKLRNSARFCLANLGPPEALAKIERVPKAEMGYVCHFLSSDCNSLTMSVFVLGLCRPKNMLCVNYIS